MANNADFSTLSLSLGLSLKDYKQPYSIFSMNLDTNITPYIILY